jgi:hypothetical protein
VRDEAGRVYCAAAQSVAMPRSKKGRCSVQPRTHLEVPAVRSAVARFLRRGSLCIQWHFPFVAHSRVLLLIGEVLSPVDLKSGLSYRLTTAFW